MPLTELMVRQAKPKEKTYSLSDSEGLSLEIRPTGKRYWIARYFVAGKEKRSSLGPYPTVGLKEAREKNVELRASVSLGKPIKREDETLGDIAKEWFEKQMQPVVSAGHLRTLQLRMDKYIIPCFGHFKLEDITSGYILRVCRKIEAEGYVDTAGRIKQIVGQIFRYAISTDRAEVDPTLPLKGALQPRRKRHHASLTGSDEIAILMRQIAEYPGEIVRIALMFSAYTFQRPGEVRHAEWKEIDLEKAEWKIPADKMKMKRPHIVPLSTQVIGLMDDLFPHTGRQIWLFPSARKDGRPMSENTIRVALRTMGYGNDDMTAHGFRSMASTNLNEQGWPPDVIERQLAHVEGNSVRAAYNYAEYLPERRKLMQHWADWLDGLK